MNCFNSSGLRPQTLENSIAILNTDLQLYSKNGLQDPLKTELVMHSSSADPSTAINLQPVEAPKPIVFTVTSTADIEDANDEVLTLREAIAAANETSDINLINFSLGSGSQTITLTGRQLAITNPVTIDGGGRLTISGNNRSRIFETSSSVTLAGVTVTDGREFRAGGILNTGTLELVNSTIRNSTAAVGGAVTNEGRLALTNSTLYNNTATTSAGGIDNHGRLTVVNSTLSGNKAGLDGGAIWNYNGFVIVQNSTITLNIADSDNDGLGNGGGISNTAGSIGVKSSIIANNYDTANNSGTGSIHPDVSGSFGDAGDNLIGDRTGSMGFTASSLVGSSSNRIDPRLGFLRDNGGYTWTHGLQADSLAIDAGDRSLVFATDQRGIQRSTPTDIGAYEAAFPHFTVDTLVDEDDGNFSAGDVSLREAIRYIDEGGIINFASNLSGTITLNLGQLSINKSLTIEGSGANVLTVSGNNQSRVFSIANAATVEINGLTIANGYLGFDAGAGIYNAGNLTIFNSMIRNNRAGGGSAIANTQGAKLNLYNSTVYNNISTSGGIGYFLNSGAAITNLGTMTMQNTTVSHNQALVSVFNNGALTINSSTITGTIGSLSIGVANGGFENIVGVTRVKNTIIAGNRSDVWGAFVSEGYNLIGNGDYSNDWRTPSVKTFINGRNGDRVGTTNAPIDPKLGALQDNGGPTWTHALLVGSLALNAADPYDRPQADQRGVLRGNRPDIGAYENAPAIARSDFATVRRGGSVTLPVLANDYDTDGDRFTIVNYSNPLGGRLTQNSDGSFTYQSRAPLPSDFFTYTISDSKGETTTATVQIRIV
jgi:CSLREA domain-containing protein